MVISSARKDFHVFIRLALKMTHLHTVKRFATAQLINQPVDLPEWSGRTPLHFAAFYDIQEAVELLLDLGADLSIDDFAGLTPCALSLRIKLDTRNFNTHRDEFRSCDKLLLNEVNIRSKYAQFFFFIACQYGCIKFVEFFLNHGFSVHTRLIADGKASSAMHIVLRNSSSLEQKKALVQLLLNNGADINDVDTVMDTALHCVSAEALAKFLLENGADRDINAQNIDGDTPLHAACQWMIPESGDLSLLLSRKWR